VARIGSDPAPHRIIGDILGNSFFEPDVRYLAAAVVLVELDQRSLVNRLLEYLYVILRLPGRDRVTVGPAQLRLSNICHPIPYCACGKTFKSFTSLRHTLGRQHQSLFLLSQLSERLVALGSAREAVNAHQKGIDAVDLSIRTVYSEVVLGLARRYARPPHPGLEDPAVQRTWRDESAAAVVDDNGSRDADDSSGHRLKMRSWRTIHLRG
jgi:hypothetical protein